MLDHYELIMGYIAFHIIGCFAFIGFLWEESFEILQELKDNVQRRSLWFIIFMLWPLIFVIMLIICLGDSIFEFKNGKRIIQILKRFVAFYNKSYE